LEIVVDFDREHLSPPDELLWIKIRAMNAVQIVTIIGPSPHQRMMNPILQHPY
jgi:hypothetical protein